MDLQQKGQDVTVVSDSSLPGSSRVAAGLINPVVFKRLLPSWKAAELLPFLQEKYQFLESLLQEKFLHSINITKVIENQHELETWQKRANAPDIRDFIREEITQDSPTGLKSPDVLGYGEVLQSGYVDTVLFLNSAAKFLKEKNCFADHSFSYADLQLLSDSTVYQGKEYHRVIFCEGFFVHRNPYFNFLPFKPVKGDVLTLNIEGYQYKKVLNKNFFLLPLADGTFKLGATYGWKNLNFEPSETAKEDLLKRLTDYIPGEIKVLKHEAGVRPSSEDRRPILGPHPDHPQLCVFNGLGTKGVMLAPFFAAQLTDHLLHNAPIDEEVFVGRFYKLKE